MQIALFILTTLASLFVSKRELQAGLMPRRRRRLKHASSVCAPTHLVVNCCPWRTGRWVKVEILGKRRRRRRFE